MSSSFFCGYLCNSLVDNWSTQCKKRAKREWDRSENPVVSPEWCGLVKQVKTFASRTTWSSAKNRSLYMTKNNVATCVCVTAFSRDSFKFCSL